MLRREWFSARDTVGDESLDALTRGKEQAVGIWKPGKSETRRLSTSEHIL